VGSDLARISFDATRGYRSVVAQQGRVTLEADINEETTIASEALRLETIDVVGPAGTPQPHGYQVVPNTSKGIVVEPGTMYLGGWRLRQDKAVALNSQPEWLDQLTLPGAAAAAEVRKREMIALLATEQSISAVEDKELREVALGGPDTTARTRLMQHFVRIPTSQSLCDPALKQIEATLGKMGLALNPNTLGLSFDANLLVSFYPPPQAANPCCPPAQGGYLGADNQLVQVAVSNFTAPHGHLLWGWNNASFLYRASVVSPHVLQLSPPPVDAAHSPQPGQVIEILKTTMVLGLVNDKNFIAAPQGLIVTLGNGSVWDGTTNQLTLPPGTTLPAETHTLFVRLWQGQVPFTSGTETHLDDASGLAVTVKITALPKFPFISRPFWSFAVRPNTPQLVYPERYLEKPQAPDGPRQWLCDLAIVEPAKEGHKWSIVADCRKHFVPLTEETECACCCLVLSASEDWVTKLNTAIAGTATALSICFQPGKFNTDTKITFAHKMVKMVGAGEGTVITGSNLEAVFEFDNCPAVNLSDFAVIAGTAGYSNNPATAGLQGAVTIRNCPQVDIERVLMACADADLRSASCLAVYNPAPAKGSNPLPFNVRILNSQFRVGHFQVGILLVNAVRAQVEGNLIITEQVLRNLTASDVAANSRLASRLRKQLLHSMTIVNTAPPVKKRVLLRLKKKRTRDAAAGTTVPATAPMEAPAAGSSAPPSEITMNAAPAESSPAIQIAAGGGKLPSINLGQVGRARINATFGSLKLEFISSDKLTNAWTEALRTSGLTQTSTAGEVHKTVRKIAEAVFKTPETVPQAFRNWVSEVLPSLYSTSAQGIVVGGDVARDIRILDNTIVGTAQGIHVGLSDRKANPVQPHLSARQVTISGNTIDIRLTAEMTGDRHGIYLGSVESAVIEDNNLSLIRAMAPNHDGFVGQDIFAIKAMGFMGRRILLERNCMLGFTFGIFTNPSVYAVPAGSLWKAAENVSTSANITSVFKVTDNVP